MSTRDWGTVRTPCSVFIGQKIGKDYRIWQRWCPRVLFLKGQKNRETWAPNLALSSRQPNQRHEINFKRRDVVKNPDRLLGKTSTSSGWRTILEEACEGNRGDVHTAILTTPLTRQQELPLVEHLLCARHFVSPLSKSLCTSLHVRYQYVKKPGAQRGRVPCPGGRLRATWASPTRARRRDARAGPAEPSSRGTGPLPPSGRRDGAAFRVRGLWPPDTGPGRAV